MSKSERVRRNISIVGSCCCLAIALLSLGMMFYYRAISGDWLDSRIFQWEFVPPISIAGVFFFTRVIGRGINW